MMEIKSSISIKKTLRNNFYFFKALLFLAYALHFVPIGLVHGEAEKSYGFNPISQEVLKDAEENLHVIIDVNPNKIGLERIQHEREANGLSRLMGGSASHEDELILIKGQDNIALCASDSIKEILPSSVDNSQLPSFPPIGDQKRLGSCVAWGTTYYQATHEYGLLNGINNKTSINHVFSPKWTYNNLNGGQDGGLMIFETYQLLTQNGIVTLDRLPYDENYQSWDLNSQDWISAIWFRTAPPRLISGLGGDTQNLQVIKQLLNNGHVLTFGTFIESWKMTTVKSDPNAKNNPHTGELAASWMNGTNGGHCMTIVGYDDNVWIDVNNDGKVDEGEKGAFLIANSWGEEWGNKGFVWIAYDAFLAQSAVVNGPTKNRVAIADAMGSYAVSSMPISRNYSPKLIAQFSLTQTMRNQISVSVGVSDINSIKPSKLFKSYALCNQGGNLEFDGTYPNGPITATFALDLTDLLIAVPDVAKRFYLVVGDDQLGNPTTIESFSVIDCASNKMVSKTAAPLTLDDTTQWMSLDYDPNKSNAPTPLARKPPVVARQTFIITSPINNQSVGNYVWLSVLVTDQLEIDRVEFYLDSILYASDKTAPYYALLLTKNLTKGQHHVTAIAYNKKGESIVESVDFYVK